MTKRIRITGGKGFQMIFANGWTVSVQFGIGNYCDHHHRGFSPDYNKANIKAGEIGSETAEVWAWDQNGNQKQIDGESEDVQGYLSTNDVLTYMVEVSQRERGEE